jgi:hypothetical protein
MSKASCFGFSCTGTIRSVCPWTRRVCIGHVVSGAGVLICKEIRGGAVGEYTNKSMLYVACTTKHTHKHKTHREIKRLRTMSFDDSCVVCLKGQIALVGQFTNTNADTNKRGTLHISLQLQRKNLHLGLPKMMIKDLSSGILILIIEDYSAEEETPSLSRFTTICLVLILHLSPFRLKVHVQYIITFLQLYKPVRQQAQTQLYLNPFSVCSINSLHVVRIYVTRIIIGVFHPYIYCNLC